MSQDDNQEIFNTLSPLHVISDIPWCGELSPKKKMKIDKSGHPLSPDRLAVVHGGTGDEDGTGCKKTRHHQIIRSQQRMCSERKRRDRVREKLRNLKELLPNTSAKLDQATILDEAARRIISLRSELQVLFSMGGRHPIACVANHGYQSLQCAPASGFMGQGIGMNYGMGFHTPWSQFLQLPPLMTSFVVPPMLISGLHSIFSHPVPGECSSSQMDPSSFSNPYKGIIQGDREPITSKIPQGQATRSMASTDATSGLVEEVTPLPSGLSRLAASSPLKVSVVTSSVMDLPLKGSRVISPLPQAFGDTESLPARTSVVGFSTSIPSNSEELGPQILRTATNPNPMPETDQRPVVQDQFSPTQFFQELATSLGSNTLEMVPGIYTEDTALFSPPLMFFP